MTIVYNHQ